MAKKFYFEADTLHSIVGGRSAIEIQKLNIHKLEDAESFIKCYGFDLNLQQDNEKLWYYYRRSLVLMSEKLGFAMSEVPELLQDRKFLKDIRQLILLASSTSAHQKELQKWSCAILRCMHVFVHAENDLFSFFSEEIQNQVLSGFQRAVIVDGNHHSTFLKSVEPGRDLIEIVRFQTKPFKTSTSTVIKLLAKPDALALKIYDKLGVRFITKSVFDSFQVTRFLIQENIISYPHIMPDQSSNNLYPTELFLEIMEELYNENSNISDVNLDELFHKKLEDRGQTARFLRKENHFSSHDYKFIKFIARKLINIQPDSEKSPFSFFFPFEVQIIDQKSYERTFSGPSDHQAYKERQKLAARKRLFPELDEELC